MMIKRRNRVFSFIFVFCISLLSVRLVGIAESIHSAEPEKMSHSIQLKEMKDRHKKERADWESSERTKRKEFFKNNSKGSARRVYVKDFLKRRKELIQKQKLERSTLVSD